MDLFLALGGSALPFPDGSELRLHSRFTHAINLTHSSGRLFTFHRYGKGCSPTGWLLRNNDFETVYQRLAPNSLLTVNNHCLSGQGFMLRARRLLSFTVPKHELALPDLRKFSHPTGLPGPLNQVLRQPDHPLLILLTQQLDRWLAGGRPDWRGIIGLGPGLTPSGDDMLTGALAALHCHQSILALNRCHLILPDFKTLLSMTTPISCGYLDSAARGEFSTPLVRLLNRLAHARECESAVRALLGHGHTSGADTLVGLVTALRWLRKVFPGVDHA